MRYSLATLLMALIFGLSGLFFAPVVEASSHLIQDDKKEDKQDDSKNDDKKSDEDDDEKDKDDKQTTGNSSESDSRANSSSRTRSTSRTRDKIVRNGESMRKLFTGIVETVSKSTVAVKSGRKQVAIGSIVDANGFILTKKSELKAPITCIFSDGSEVPAYVFGIDSKLDLALLKVEKSKLTPIDWSNATPRAGSWLATTHPDGDATSLGIVSVGPRKIPGGYGFMGIEMDLTFEGKGALVSKVNSDSPAERAGLKVSDIIVRAGEKEINSSQDLGLAVRSKKPGDKIMLTAKRKSNIVDIEIVLGSHLDLNPNLQRSNFQNNMGGKLSRRRHDFPLAFQHDSALSPSQCGGPVVNLEGEAVGINVARSGRVSSLALPVSEIIPVIEMLKTGQYAPAIVNKAEIQAITIELEKIDVALANDPETSKLLTAKLEKLSKQDVEANKELQAAIEKVKEANTALAQAKQELSVIEERVKLAEKQKKQLEKQREQLVTGIEN